MYIRCLANIGSPSMSCTWGHSSPQGFACTWGSRLDPPHHRCAWSCSQCFTCWETVQPMVQTYQLHDRAHMKRNIWQLVPEHKFDSKLQFLGDDSQIFFVWHAGQIYTHVWHASRGHCPNIKSLEYVMPWCNHTLQGQRTTGKNNKRSVRFHPTFR